MKTARKTGNAYVVSNADLTMGGGECYTETGQHTHRHP